MGKEKINVRKDVLCKLGKYADIPLDELDKSDAIILRDLSLVYIKTVSAYLSCNGKTIDSKSIDEAKIAFHTVTRMKLKYTLRQIDTVWGLYRRFDSIIKEYVNIAEHSAAHGEAIKVLNESRSRDEVSKAKYYDEFEVPIKNMVALWNKIDKTKNDCKAKINEARGMFIWIKEHLAWVGVGIPVLASILLCTSVETIRNSIVGKLLNFWSRVTFGSDHAKPTFDMGSGCKVNTGFNDGVNSNAATGVSADATKQHNIGCGFSDECRQDNSV